MGSCDHLDLFFVRHGITDWNQEKKYLGHTDRGVLQGELYQLEELKTELKKESFDQIYTSDLQRCQETLAYLQLSPPISVDARLREINFGDWEGKTYEELQHNQSYQNWLDNWERYLIPNGESGEQFTYRIDSFLNELFISITKNSLMTKQQILIMTHGGVIRYIVSKYVLSKNFWDLSIKHGHGLCLTFVKQKGGWGCSLLQEVPFQEKES